MGEVTFTIFSPEDPWYEMGSGVALLHGLWSEVEGHGPDCAVEIAEDYFEHEDWEGWFGEDDGAVVIVEVVLPFINRGLYEVCMERKIKATATQTKDPRP